MNKRIVSTKRGNLSLIIAATMIAIIVVGLVWVRFRNENQPVEHSSGEFSSDAIKIIVDGGGVYRLPASQLDKFGFDIRQNEKWVLTYRGIHLPFWLDEARSPNEMFFYAPASKSSYTSKTILLLSKTPSIPGFKDTNVYQALSRVEDVYSSLPTQIHQEAIFSWINLEEDAIYQPQAEQENWFWDKLVSSGEKKVTVELNHLQPGEGYLHVRFWSSTEAGEEPDHAAQVKINGVLVIEDKWDGKGFHELQGIIPDGVLKNGENEILFTGVSLPGINVDISYLDRLDIYYPRETRGEGGELEFLSVRDMQSLSLKGFSDPAWLLDVTNPLSPTLESTSLMNITLQKNRRYFAIDKEGIRDVDQIAPVREITAEQAQNHRKADYLAIGSADMLKELEPLLAFRQKEGLVTSTQTLEGIFDQYAGGYPEPHAIQRFLSSISKENPNLRYVLLVGDYTYDQHDLDQKFETNMLPTFFVQTAFGGQTSSELPFALEGEDFIETLHTAQEYPLRFAVGRLPASQPQQVRVWVKKVLDFEQKESTKSQRTIVAVADPNGDTFSTDAQTFLDLWSENYRKALYAPPAGTTDAYQRIQKEFSNGVYMISYFGHGSINMWGKDQLFTSEEAKALSNQSYYPIVMQMTCLAGYYIHPKNESITEALLWNPNGGAVFIIAPTSLTLPNDQFFFSRSWANEFQQAYDDDRLGDVWIKAISKVRLTSQGVRDVMATYTLFGDPAMNIP